MKKEENKLKQVVNIRNNAKVGNVTQEQVLIETKDNDKDKNATIAIINRVLLVFDFLLLAIWVYKSFSYNLASYSLTILGIVIVLLFPKVVLSHILTRVVLVFLLIIELIIIF